VGETVSQTSNVKPAVGGRRSANLESLISGFTWDERGLLPAIVQDAETGEVLTLAYMNAESLRLTLETGETWFWSRSRQELWHKGATSGNVQHVVEVRYDCDGDALLVRVKPAGPACHTGERTCFYRKLAVKGEPSCP
jgi:phosphoribosyl-ATP pyrophosphohydrolase/phosphoribosyl-AMP cyclohydrolase